MANPVTYAETVLGVHEVFKYAEVLHDELVNRQLELEEAQKLKRQMADGVEQAEIALIIQKRGENSELSQTAFEKRIKEWMFQDKIVQQTRRHLSDSTSKVEYQEHLVRAVELKLKIQIARMNELGGYLQYLAAAKLATLTAVHAST